MDRREEKLLAVPTWPTRQDASRARWFSPVRLGRLEVETRTWVPAMVPWRASADGEVTDEVLAWYERFARGRPGVIVVEATGIREVPSGPLLRAGDDRFVGGLARLVETVRQASGGRTKLMIQLIDFLAIRRRLPREVYLSRFLEIGPRLREALGAPWLSAGDAEVRAHLLGLPESELLGLLTSREVETMRYGLRERVTDTHLPHIADLPRQLPPLFAKAARRCLSAGFDGVELHYAHAYTMASFLSALNHRRDGYGTTLEGRVRLPLEVYQAVRAEVGAGLVVGCRLLADEIVDGGHGPEDAASFCVALGRAGVDFLSLSRGGKFEDAKVPKVGQAAYPYTGRSGHECMPTTRIDGSPWGRNAKAVAHIKGALRAAGVAVPVVYCGGIATFQQAESLLAFGEADIVASARQSLADPDWFTKLREGRGAEIRRCLFTNYCEGLDQTHQPVTCQRWDRLRGCSDDDHVGRASDGRRLTAPPD